MVFTYVCFRSYLIRDKVIYERKLERDVKLESAGPGLGSTGLDKTLI